MLFALFLGFHMGKQKQGSFHVSSIKPSGKIHLQKIEVKMDINDILTHKPTREGNAADLYIQALTGMTSSIFLSGYIPNTALVNYSTIPELELIEKAALIKECHFIPQYASPVLTYDKFTTPNFGPYNSPPGKFGNIVRLLISKGEQFENKKKLDNAISEYEAAILLCDRIMRDAVNLSELMWTLPFENSTLVRLESSYRSQGNSKMVEKCGKYLDGTKDAFSLINQKRKVFISSNLKNLSSSTAGFSAPFQSRNLSIDSIDNIIELALLDQDPVWRRLAILNLGTHRYDGYKKFFVIKLAPPYEGKIESILEYISTHDSDSTIRIAADNALKLKDYKP